MINFLKWLFAPVRRHEEKAMPRTFTPVTETEGGKLYAKIANNLCPDCGSREGFYKGPSGGLSTNIFCVNRVCRSGFNITPVIGTADRIQKGDIRRYPEVE